jgi:hypothetical protein
MELETAFKGIKQLKNELELFYVELCHGKNSDFTFFEKKIIKLFEEINNASPDIILAIQEETQELYHTITKISELIIVKQNDSSIISKKADKPKKRKHSIEIANDL